MSYYYLSLPRDPQILFKVKIEYISKKVYPFNSFLTHFIHLIDGIHIKSIYPVKIQLILGQLQGVKLNRNKIKPNLLSKFFRIILFMVKFLSS